MKPIIRFILTLKPDDIFHASLSIFMDSKWYKFYDSNRSSTHLYKTPDFIPDFILKRTFKGGTRNMKRSKKLSPVDNDYKNRMQKYKKPSGRCEFRSKGDFKYELEYYEKHPFDPKWSMFVEYWEFDEL